MDYRHRGGNDKVLACPTLRSSLRRQGSQARLDRPHPEQSPLPTFILKKMGTGVSGVEKHLKIKLVFGKFCTHVLKHMPDTLEGFFLKPHLNLEQFLWSLHCTLHQT